MKQLTVSAYRSHVQFFQSPLRVRPTWHGFERTGNRGAVLERGRENSVNRYFIYFSPFPTPAATCSQIANLFFSVSEARSPGPYTTVLPYANCSGQASSGYNLWLQLRILHTFRRITTLCNFRKGPPLGVLERGYIRYSSVASFFFCGPRWVIATVANNRKYKFKKITTTYWISFSMAPKFKICWT